MSESELALRTERLLLHRWRSADVDAFADLNVDPVVMEFLGPPRTRQETDAMVAAFEKEWDDKGYGIFAVTWTETGASIGFIGLHEPTFVAPFTPCVEIGWRLAQSAWGRGLATEGALAVRQWAHGPLGLDEIVSMTARVNVRSRRVMEKIGLHHDPADDFDHPGASVPSHLRPHVLYRGRADEFEASSREVSRL